MEHSDTAFLSCSHTASGQSCLIECNNGFSRVGPASLVCMGQKWGTGTSCQENGLCASSPSIANARELSDCKMMGNGGMCDIQCAPGYIPSSPSVQCKDGVWLGAATCKQGADCGSVPAVPNAVGDANCAGTVSGSKCQVLCAPGYKPIPKEIEVCQAFLFTCCLNDFSDQNFLWPLP